MMNNANLMCKFVLFFILISFLEQYSIKHRRTTFLTSMGSQRRMRFIINSFLIILPITANLIALVPLGVPHVRVFLTSLFLDYCTKKCHITIYIHAILTLVHMWIFSSIALILLSYAILLIPIPFQLMLIFRELK